MNKPSSIRKKSQHVIPVGNGWAVKGEGSSRFTVITDNKREAVNYAKNIARNNSSELIVHGKDGKISKRNSYARKRNSQGKKSRLILKKPS
jgi:hypothetical protein